MRVKANGVFPPNATSEKTMSNWVSALEKYKHEFFPERFSDEELISVLSDWSMPAENRARIAKELVQRPSFDADATIAHLKVQWWGDENPIGYHLAWEALEEAR